MTGVSTGSPLPRRTELLLLALVVAAGIARIVATYPVFTHTYDEPSHIGAALEWLDRGTYLMSVQNPPLGRIATGVGPYLMGARLPAELPGPVPVLSAGQQVLYAGDYGRMLTFARAGNLFWFLVGIAVVWQVSRKLYGTIAALAAALIFTSTPAVLTFGSVATNDMAIIATLPAAVAAFAWWLDDPSWPRAALAGATAAVALVCKLTSAVFFPASVVVLLAWRWYSLRGDSQTRLPRRMAAQVSLALLAAFLVIWGTYRFSLLPAERVNELNMPEFPAGMAFHRAFEVTGLPMPAPEFVAGVEQSWAMNYLPSYFSYFMGERRLGGHRWYYPVVFAVKTPLPLLALLAGGCIAAVMIRRRGGHWLAATPPLVVLGIFLAALTIKVNTGIRYIAPVYAFVAITVAACASWLVDRSLPKALRASVLVLLVALVALVARSHPDYLPYFNALAGDHPERIVVDGDLDWGQDLGRLAEEVERRGIREISVAYFGTAIPDRHITTARVRYVPPGQPVTGWVAVSQMVRSDLVKPFGGWGWLASYRPVARVGYSIYLYYIPPAHDLE